ncbi:MAG: DNA-directed RNA polymerase subunit K/omega [Candidatus Woesearchaeota archaeon]|jgi:DNA-directed RNA polymerase subunit K/omega
MKTNLIPKKEEQDLKIDWEAVKMVEIALKEYQEGKAIRLRSSQRTF